MTAATAYKPTPEEQEEFNGRLIVARTLEEAVPPRYVNDNTVVWSPQEGSQTAFMSCRLFECLFHGTRGNGKTDSLIMAFAQHVGKGYGAAWSGVIFRQTYPQLADVQAKSEKWFRQIFPAARFNRSKMTWEWPTGERLLLRHMARSQDYWNYHGHEYPFIGWEELTNWANDQCYKLMMACCRSATPGVPKMIRATTNPYGVGHNWVKGRFQLHGKWWLTVVILDAVDISGRPEPHRCAIHGHINENKILLNADPDYKTTIIAAATSKAVAEAWLDGSWDIVSGGMFDDLYEAKYHIVDEFVIPKSWRIERAFDWGSSRPFSVGWWAMSDGCDVDMPDGSVRSTVKGDRFRIGEWYGTSGGHNEGLKLTGSQIATGIVEREIALGLRNSRGAVTRVKPGPADSSIFDDSTDSGGRSIGDQMRVPVRVNGIECVGVAWIKADKSPGSRKRGWEAIRQLLKDGKPPKGGGPREHPGLFVFRQCKHWIELVPSLPRDDKDPDDVDTDVEDHCFVAETLVDTPDGQIRIADMNETGFVHTIDGPKFYRSARKTRSNARIICLTFQDGTRVCCTPEHKFLTEGGWVGAIDMMDKRSYAIRNFKKIGPCQRLFQRLFRNSTVSDTIFVACIFKIKVEDCIVRFGDISTALFKKTFTFIISTVIVAITDLKISYAFQGRSTCGFMAKSPANVGSRIWRPQDLLRRGGINQARGESGINFSMKSIVPPLCIKEFTRPACNALGNLTGFLGKDQSFAATNARRHIDAIRELIMNNGFASYVKKYLASTSIEKRNRVRDHVLKKNCTVIAIEDVGFADVYCLTVPNTNSFCIEGGLVVHNCGDETRYYVVRGKRDLKRGRTVGAY